MSDRGSSPAEKAGSWRERFPNRKFSGPEITYLNQRYGNVKRISWKIPALILFLLGTPWLIWSATHHSLPEIRYTLISFERDQFSATPSIDITYEVTRRNPRIAVTCTLVARDIDKNIVGEITDRFPPSNKSVTAHKTRIPARSTPVNAAVIRCATS